MEHNEKRTDVSTTKSNFFNIIIILPNLVLQLLFWDKEIKYYILMTGSWQNRGSGGGLHETKSVHSS